MLTACYFFYSLLYFDLVVNALKTNRQTDKQTGIQSQNNQMLEISHKIGLTSWRKISQVSQRKGKQTKEEHSTAENAFAQSTNMFGLL